MRYLFYYVVWSAMSLVASEALAATPLTFKQALGIAYRNNPELQAEIDKAQAMRGFYPKWALSQSSSDFNRRKLWRLGELFKL